MLGSFCHQKTPRRYDKELKPRPSHPKIKSLSIRPQNAAIEFLLQLKSSHPKAPNFIEIWRFWSRRQNAPNFIEIWSFCDRRDRHQKAPNFNNLELLRPPAARQPPNFDQIWSFVAASTKRVRAVATSVFVPPPLPRVSLAIFRLPCPVFVLA